ncbi:MAG: class I SAM-dependent methyltransferase, partial [Gammaproteobacteria bacterium]
MAENTISAILARATTELAAQSDSARLDAELLLSRVLGRGRASFRAHPDECIGADERAQFDALAARRAAGEPVAYLLGEREFWSLPVQVAPGVLIPRPDTETLVAAALEVAGGADDVAVADLGTGSGAVALAL